MVVVRGILPYYTADSNTTMAAKLAAHQGAETIVIWLTFVALAAARIGTSPAVTGKLVDAMGAIPVSGPREGRSPERAPCRWHRGSGLLTVIRWTPHNAS